MSHRHTLPSWVQEYVTALQTNLFLHPWAIRLRCEPIIDNDPNTMASCAYDTKTSSATITFRADIEDSAEWRQTIAHEMLHIAHARVDIAVQAITVRLPNQDVRALAEDVYTHAVEPFIDLLATTIYEYHAGVNHEGEICSEETDDEGTGGDA